MIKNAHYLILSNSSFAFFPAWISEKLKYALAPKYWGRYNISEGYWNLGYNLTSRFDYLDRAGNINDYRTCQKELTSYIEKNKDIYSGGRTFKPSIIRSIQNNIHIFFTVRKDTSSLYALMWIAHARGLRMAVEAKARLLKEYKRSRKIARRLLDWKETAVRHIRWNLREYNKKRHWQSPQDIRKYRKTIQIYDAFNFFNELELLEIRLNILAPHVDHFIIVESTLTHSGLPKKLYFQENRHLFKKFEDKIIHYVIDKPLKSFEDAQQRLLTEKDPLEKSILQAALTSDNVAPGKAHFLRDFYEKESIKKALVGLKDTDICYVSDLDEIWNPELLIDYSKDDIFKPIQIGYIYYLNNRTSQEDWKGWTGTIVVKYKNIKNECLNHLRTHRKMKSRYVVLKNGGWHFSFVGGAERVKQKVESYSHQELNNENTKSQINKILSDNKDIRGYDLKFWKDERDLPEYLKEHKKQYEHLFKQ